MKVLAVTAACLGAASVACAKKDTDEAPEAHAARVVTGVQIDAATEGPFAVTVELSGLVAGRPGHVASLSAPAPARISAVLAVAGQRVTEGAVLVRLDSTGFAAAVRAADAALNAASAAHVRAQRLVDAGVATRRELEQATTELAAAKGTAETAHRAYDLSVVRAPFAGVVSQVNAVVGATADPAIPMIQMADARALDVALSAAPEQAAQLQLGAAVTVVTGGANVAAVISAVGGAVDSATRSVPVRAEIRGASSLAIGQAVTARVTATTLRRTVLVPIEALVPAGEGFKVFVVGADSVAVSRDVVVQGRSATQAAIGSGLARGDRIVTGGAYGLDDSVKVAPAARQSKSAAP